MFMWADNGVVTCVKAETGETIWRERVGGEFYGSPVCAGQTLWAMSRKGKLVGVSAAAQFRLVGAFGERAEGIGAALARAHLQRQQRQLSAQLAMRDGELLAHVLNRLVEPHARFDRDHHKIERVRQLLREERKAARNANSQEVARRKKAALSLWIPAVVGRN